MTEKEAQLLAQAEAWIKEKLAADASGHDFWHVIRVCLLAKIIAQEEEGDVFICQLAALLHDMADDKLNDDPKKAHQDILTWLADHDVSQKQSDQIMTIIDTISFKGGHGKPLTSLEAKIVQDADRLDAIGAIGIARCMAYSGHTGRLIHDPDRLPRETMTVEEYRKDGTAIMHFYEKLLTLKNRMNTAYGRQLAEHRHQVLVSYLDEFYAEWDGLR
ncbi:HD domain-containing protein [Streptococcus dysgalactiae]|uniref:Metal-dependent phosphohydrolase n=1 Tax=Streptococcus dysgalactiae subsp. dysgalactiae TaxID=99822 RepID=A0A380JVC0_STRDY|nr:HD domain-containing protein [Streptococcus dysgalactiae]EFY02870.1 metal-dependent phosphohydrolase [Streptococcus dysgalactiae subsp. dysgalactiae ATCC 27957]MCB2829369.1 HD domain-containing protein [Streptococcus dysgalactiae subsp. dysgalactiae]MCB2831658.1 HD domain-containing protein [Streptococcus dysgalactiae subsp. dysgalactiae]MCB2832957.1 HD domain-containing protein [Streptococcus dysgalactiae subsp. dysgalactiae]MCB2835365.1 HD domain-containing protein [Streptococcus dysgalac